MPFLKIDEIEVLSLEECLGKKSLAQSLASLGLPDNGVGEPMYPNGKSVLDVLESLLKSRFGDCDFAESGKEGKKVDRLASAIWSGADSRVAYLKEFEKAKNDLVGKVATSTSTTTRNSDTPTELNFDETANDNVSFFAKFDSKTESDTGDALSRISRIEDSVSLIYEKWTNEIARRFALK